MVALGRYLMGTRFEVVLAGGDDPARLRAAGEEALDEVERIEGLLSVYRPDSVISTLNARAGGEWVRVPEDVFGLLETALEVARATHGAFDVTLLPLMRAWGFVGGSGAPAGEEQVRAARELTGPDRILLDTDTSSVRFDRPGVGLDLGAIGKGYALDHAVDTLADAGISSALIHGGTSTVMGLGAPADGEAWRIAVRNPGNAESAVATVALAGGQALSVSAGHGKAFTDGAGQVLGHVLDPRTGAPSRGAVLAAVVMDSATRADAFSTALLVLGTEGLPVLDSLEPGASGFVISKSDVRRTGGAFEAAVGSP